MTKDPQMGQFPRPDSIYYHVAYEALEAAKKANIENQDDKFFRRKRLVTCMVFSALCLEAYINQEYSSHKETRSKLKKSDRTPLEKKWLDLPCLLGAEKTFKENDFPYLTLKELIGTRNNRLVHFKPAEESKSDKGFHQDKTNGYFIDLIDSVEVSERFFECIGLMIKELNNLTNHLTEIPDYLEGEEYSEETMFEVTRSL